MFTLPKESFSSDGYIIDQSKLSSIPFGKFPSSQNGCGWIAAWNLCQSQKQNLSTEKIRTELSHTLLFGGKIGAHVIALFFYLRFVKRLPIQIHASLRPLVSKKHYVGGILMYHTGHTFHYVTFLKQSQGNYRFLNGVYGLQNDVRSMQKFLSEQSNFPFVIVLPLKAFPSHSRQ